MSHPLGMTTGRMLGAAALSAPYFGVLVLTVLLVSAVITSATYPNDIIGRQWATTLLFCVGTLVCATAAGAIVAVFVGFPLALLTRRLLRRATRVRSVLIGAFVTGVVPSGVIVGVAAPAVTAGTYVGEGPDPAAIAGLILYYGALALAAGVASMAAWYTLWLLSPERVALRATLRSRHS